jgi:hypothetical protein
MVLPAKKIKAVIARGFYPEAMSCTQGLLRLEFILGLLAKTANADPELVSG